MVGWSTWPEILTVSDIYWKPHEIYNFMKEHEKECQLIWTANSSDFLSQNGNGLILESILAQNLLSEILKMESHLKNATTKRFVNIKIIMRNYDGEIFENFV